MLSAIAIISALRVKFWKKNIKYWPGIKIYSSMHLLPEIFLRFVIFDISKDI